MPGELAEAIVTLDHETAELLVRRRAETGEPPLAILSECREGMAAVGDRFQSGDYYLSELMVSGELFKTLVAILDPYLSRLRPAESLATVVLATLEGDIHDLGKNLLATLLDAQGFAVHDLGVDVAPACVVDKVKQVEADFVGFSALMTTSFPGMQRAARMLEEAGLRDHLKLLIGGGVTTPMVKDYVGADFQTLNASDGVAYCLEHRRGG